MLYSWFDSAEVVPSLILLKIILQNAPNATELSIGSDKDSVGRGARMRFVEGDVIAAMECFKTLTKLSVGTLSVKVGPMELTQLFVNSLFRQQHGLVGLTLSSCYSACFGQMLEGLNKL